jgi:2',3'-cyclic-nucleotide 2'-phosphodiesterase / 3'-nucleotidase
MMLWSFPKHAHPDLQYEIADQVDVRPSVSFASMSENRNIKSRARTRLRLLATTDLHMHLTAYDYYADRVDDAVGLTRTARLIHTAKAESRQNGALVLLFDNGDSLQGTPMGDLAIQTPEAVHPLMRAFDHLGYDAIGLGNHDFNFGLEPLLAVIAQAPCPVVCSNIRRVDGGALAGVRPFVILERALQGRPIRIGVLSLLPPQTIQWDAHNLHGVLVVDDMVETARRQGAALRRAGCDVVVALAHSGLDDTPAHDGMENAVLPLAALNDIDAVIAGHTHLQLPGPAHAGLDNVDTTTGDVHGTPVVMPGTAGSHLGVIDLRLRAEANDCWAIDRFDCALRPVSMRHPNGTAKVATDEDEALQRLLAPAHAATRAFMQKPVGRTDKPLHSYFSFIAPDRALAVVALAQAAKLRRLLAGSEAGDLPLLSATAPCKFGGRSGPSSYTDVPAGDVLLRHAADLHVFPNELRAVIVTGQQIFDWLEDSARLFNQIAPGSCEAPLVNPSVPGHDFDVLHGLTWQIDLAAPPWAGQTGQAATQGRISDVRYRGTPVTADQRFVVALNNYRASGGGGFTALNEAVHLPIPPINIREVICDFLAGNLSSQSLDYPLQAWRFRPMPATSITLPTGPGATAYLDELADRDVTVCGPGADGFLNLTLPL